MRHSIPSFVPADTASATGKKVATFAESHTEQELVDHLSQRENGNRLVAEIFDGLRDDWRLLVSDHVRGRCLDLGTGYGARSLMLADLADSVDAVDSSLNRLRVLAASDHNLRSKVRPVHATIDRLPFADGVFDTIVAAPLPDADLEMLVSRVGRLLAPEGSLVLKLDGQFDRGEVPDGEQADTTRTSFLAGLWRRRLGHYRRTLEDEFASVQFYSLFPTKTKGQFVFPNEDTSAVNHLLSDKVDRKLNGVVQAVTERLVPLAARAGAFPRGSLAICSDRESDVPERLPDPPGLEECERLLVRGQRRAVVIYFSDGEIALVRKIPKNTRTALYDDSGAANVNEHTLLRELRKTDDPIVDTFPEGDLEQTSLGPVRSEQPTGGVLVGKRISRTPGQFRENLTAGFEWVADFQEAYGEKRDRRTPEEIRRELSLPELGLEAPNPPQPVTLFDTPVKSDHSPENLFVDPETVDPVGVIDWERGARRGNPFVDPCKYALTLTTRTFGGFEQGIDEAFVSDTPYATILRNAVEGYAERLGLEPRGFVTYLAAPDVHKLETDHLDESKPTIWYPDVVDRIEYIWDRQSAILDRLT